MRELTQGLFTGAAYSLLAIALVIIATEAAAFAGAIALAVTR